ncbi:hypothetical protein ABG768_001853 [Culter alburnus]|uniref:Sushi domain-containing protein n=1 Tax=Culter alburnus TaxID=194366 RepID=A0AAW2A463_CULAL
MCAAPNIPNAEILEYQRSEYNTESRIRYQCHPGFEPEQHVYITCNSRTEWTGIQQCTGKMCAAPNIPNAEILGDQRPEYNINSRIQYKCRPGFEPEQPVEITCNFRTEWADIQQCTAKQLCPDLSVENGLIHTLPSNKEEIFYTCDTGYKPFHGNWWDSVTCSRGSWSEKPWCIREEECGAFPSVLHGKLKQTKQIFKDGETTTFECDPGFKPTQRFIRCDNGTWETPVCEVDVHCDIPPKVENAFITSKPEEFYGYGSSVTYVCQSSFLMKGKSTVFCRSETWEEAPTCKEVMCVATLTENMRSDVTDDGHPGPEISVRSGRTITLSCLGTGVKLQGDKKISCLSNGEWNVPFPKCIREATCPLNTTDEDLIMKRSPDIVGPVKPGDKLIFSCNREGLKLKGEREITCQSNGEWSSPFPKCEEVMCFANLKVNMRSDGHPGPEVSVRPGHTITLSCVGRELQGQSKIRCLSDGQWDVPFPKCIRGKCGPPPNVNFADTMEMTKRDYSSGERVEYTCFNKYTLVQSHPYSKYLTCEHGEWRGNIKCLKPCSVTVELMDERGIELRWRGREKIFSSHGDRITFRCKSGKYSVGSDLSQICNDGEMDLPHCV